MVGHVINYGGIHKPRGQLRGRGVSQMTILLHKPELIRVQEEEIGEGVKNAKNLSTWFIDDPR